MIILLIILYGAIAGFMASKYYATGFGKWWDIYTGATGAVMASSVLLFGYFADVLPKRGVIGLNFYTIVVGFSGAIVLLLLSRFYNKTFRLKNNQK